MHIQIMFTFFETLYDIADVRQASSSGNDKFFRHMTSAKAEARLWNTSSLTTLDVVSATGTASQKFGEFFAARLS